MNEKLQKHSSKLSNSTWRSMNGLGEPLKEGGKLPQSPPSKGVQFRDTVASHLARISQLYKLISPNTTPKQSASKTREELMNIFMLIKTS